MIRLIIVIFCFLIIQDVRAQKLNFSDLDHIPEYFSNTAFYWSNNDCWVLPSAPRLGTGASVPTGNILAYSFYGEDFKYEYLDSHVPRSFEYINDSLIIGASFDKLYLLSPNGITEIYSQENNERILKVFPTFNNNVSYYTDQGIYHSSDFGVTFAMIETFNNSFFLQSDLYSETYYSLFFDGTKYQFQERDTSFNLITSIDLNYEPYSFTILNDTIYISGTDKIIRHKTISETTFNLKFIPELGESAIPKIYDNQLFIYKFREKQILKLNNDLEIIELINIQSNNFLLSERGNELFFYTNLERFKPTSLSPLIIDTVMVDATATDLKGFEIVGDDLTAVTPTGIYHTEINNSQWIESETEDSVGHGGIQLISFDNLIVYTSGELLKSVDNGISFQQINSPTMGPSYSYGDTTISIGFQVCSDLGQSAVTLISPDGGDSWPVEIESPRCFSKRFHTVTDDRVYFYNQDQSYALGPGNAIYSWFAYYDRNDKRFVYVGGDRDIMPFIPTSSNQFTEKNVCFYVSPEEIFYANPLKDNISGYHSLDRGETWIETTDSPMGRIYPTPDSTGTIVIQNDPDGKRGTKFYVRYDEAQPYVELDINIDLPPIEYLKYTSDGRMIVASEKGYFYISDGITSTIDDVREALTALTIYPNPTTDILYIRSEYSISLIDIMDFNGRSVYVSKATESVDMSAWNTGVYLVSAILGDGRQITRKVVKM